jgi:molybdopterin converting factor small subunit
MATVHLPHGLVPCTGGLDTVEVDASRIRDLIAELTARFPRLADQLDTMAVAVDGEIYQDPGYQAVGRDSEVHFVPRIAGGSAESREPNAES